MRGRMTPQNWAGVFSRGFDSGRASLAGMTAFPLVPMLQRGNAYQRQSGFSETGEFLRHDSLSENTIVSCGDA